MMVAIRGELVIDARVELANVLIELLQTGELHFEHETMVLFDLSFERELEGRPVSGAYASLRTAPSQRALRRRGGVP